MAHNFSLRAWSNTQSLCLTSTLIVQAADENGVGQRLGK